MNSTANRYEFGFDPRQFLDFETKRPDVPDGPAFDAQRVRLLSMSEFYDLAPSADQISAKQLVYLTMVNNLIWSSHNTNPRRVRFVPDKPNSLDVLADRKAVLPASDGYGRQTGVGMGAALKGYELVAGCFGVRITIDTSVQTTNRLHPFHQGEPRYEPIARISFRPDGEILPNSRQILEAMRNRKVVRARYNGTPLPRLLSRQIWDLNNTVDSSVRLHLVEDSQVKLVIARAAENAEKEVLEDPAFKHEFGESIAPNTDNTTPSAMRFQEFLDRRGPKDDKEANRLRQGLLGVPGMLSPVELYGMAHGTYQNIASSSAVAIFTAPLDNLNYCLEVGKLQYGLAILAAQHNFVTAVHAGVSEVDDAKRELTSRYFPGEDILGLIRIGKVLSNSALKRPHSSRPSIEELFV